MKVGVVLVLRPGVGALAVVLWIATYAIVLGVLLIALAFRRRSWGHSHIAGGTMRTARARRYPIVSVPVVSSYVVG